MSVKGLSAFHLLVDTQVKQIMKDGKITIMDLPAMVILISDLITFESSVKLTADDLIVEINSMYDYIMTHYKLFPEDVDQQTQFKTLFDMCVKLVLYQPKTLKVVKKCIPCLV